MATAVVVEAERQTSPAANDSPKKRKSQIDEIEVDLSLPEPPSKKAKRLLKKGKPLPAKPQSDDEGEPNDGLPVPAKEATKGKEKNKRSEHGVWIGNLPFTLTRVELFKWLVESSGGAIKEENITRVNLPTRRDGGRDRRHGQDGEAPKPQSRGFAYVDFDAASAAVAAMALTETELGGRKVLIKSSTSFEGRPQKENAPSAENGVGPAGTTANGGAATAGASRKIYVGNLSFQTDEDDLRAHFDRCGEIDWIKVATFEDSGKCKGYGWVKFREPEAAAWAVKGFVKIREEIETEDDFRDDDAAPTTTKGDGDDDGEEGGEKEDKKFKTRKWWVNRLKGRELKIELAEDDQVRYKKRFGKDAPLAAANKAHGKRRDTAPPRPADNGKEGGTDAREEKTRPEGAKKKGAYGDAGVASYLTGAVVKPQGKKITFD
ncbi:Nucleolar protein 13 [Parahypoxylon ruwenzoriense]